MGDDAAVAVARRYVDAWRRKDEPALRRVLADHVRAHGPGLRASAEGDAVVSSFATPAFELDDIRLHDVVAAGDRVAIRYEVIMRQVAAIAGVDPGARELHEHGMQFLRLEGDRIAEIWTQNDQVGFLGQVGVRELPKEMLVGTPSA